MMELQGKSSGVQPVVIVGGGVVGLCAALALQQAGLAVCVIDPDCDKPASWGNAGHLAIEQVEPLAAPATLARFGGMAFALGGPLDMIWRDFGAWLPWSIRFLAASTPGRFAAGAAMLEALNVQALPAWRRLLGDDAGALLRTEGHWLVWETPQRTARGHRRLARVRTGATAHRPLAPAERDALAQRSGWPLLDGVHVAGTGQITDLVRLRETLTARLSQAGASLVTARVERLEPGSGGVTIHLDRDDPITAAAAVAAAGVWSRALLEKLGLSVPLIAERGYHVEIPHSDWPHALSPVVFEDRAMVMTRFADRLRVTSFAEFGRAATPPDARKWGRLEDHLRALGLLADGPVSRWMGSRPTLPDYLPAIGGGEVAGIYYALGHGHLGLTLAALSGELVRAAVLGGDSPIGRPVSDLRRFGRARTT